ncbi:radical SAM protein [Candidatus Bathyarchaeota archaeon]|nr:radical SAM protein [Candidatus Bathyarchaeota archaeon]
MSSVSRPGSGRALDDPGVRAALPRYVDIVNGKKYPKYLIAQSMPAEYSRRADLDDLWGIHDSQLERYHDYEEGIKKKPRKTERSFLDLKIQLAHTIMQGCCFCERRCNADRLHGDRGYCRAGRNFSLFSAFPHMGEEPELVPSGTIFTGGCSIRCLHCQNWDISQWQSNGESLTPEMMALQVEELAEKGCRNINMVGGDPTPYVWHWLETMNHAKQGIATVWNSNGCLGDTSRVARNFMPALVWNSNSYYSIENAKLLAGFIDVYLLDFKYGNNKCATEISDAPGYWETCTRNHLYAKKYGELIIRVLVLPEHNECCARPILQWIHDNLGPMTRVNLMFQYRPEWRAKERPELSRRLTTQEITEAKQIAQEVGLKNLVKE